MTTVALTIAGSDPSGGAGIQSDLRTFAALGIVGVSVLTALTVQNSLGVQSVHPVAADILAAQLEAILSDTKVDAVKIGMLGGADQVRVIAAALRKYQPPNIVLDPVLASTGGVPLLDEAGRQVLLTELMPLCDLITPNLEESGILTNSLVNNLETMQAAGERLLALGVKAVLVKGGHLNGEPIDLLVQPGLGPTRYLGNRVATIDTHGTGCLFSSLIAGNLAIDDSIGDMISESKRLLTRALRHALRIGKGRGYPDILAVVCEEESWFSHHAERLSCLHGLYVLTDPDLRSDRLPQEIVEAALAGGAKSLQLRDKYLPTPHLISLARELCVLARKANALFFINDRVDVAMAADADGVHLGPDDMRPEDARLLLGSDKLIGVSVATVEEAKAAAPWASYFGVGAIFGSKTKLDAGEPIGVGRIREIKAAFPNIPIVAIGGINMENISEVARAGADAAAVVSAVVSAPDMEAATRDLVQRFEAGKT